MSELIERLRQSAKAYGCMMHDRHAADCNEAADELTRLQALVEQLADLLAASRMGLSVLLDTAADFTEVDQQNCEQARNLIGRIDTTLSTAKDPGHGG